MPIAPFPKTPSIGTKGIKMEYETIEMDSDKPIPPVTPEMEAAGTKELWASGITDGRVEADKLVVADIFRAMYRLLPR